MNPHVDTLFRLLPPADQIQLGLCNRNALRNFPISRLYYTVLPKCNRGRVRRMKTMKYGVSELNLTHLHLMTSTLCLSFFSFNPLAMESLVYLKMEECVSNLELPWSLKTFIGINIRKSLTLCPSLTHLELQGSRPRIVGLDDHPNLTILRLKISSLPRTLSGLTLPPNLVELETREFLHDPFPGKLRVLRLTGMCPSGNYGVLHLPDDLEELDVRSTSITKIIPKLPIGLRVLALFSFAGILPEELQACSKLCKIVIHGGLTKQTARTSLKLIERFVPQITDLSFCTNHPCKSMQDLTFVNLRRLCINLGTMWKESSLKLRNLTKLRFLEIHYGFAKHDNCQIELPLGLRSLMLRSSVCQDSILRQNITEFVCKVTDTYRVSINVPLSLRILQIDESFHRHAFYIGISREHLATLEIIGDRGQVEQNGRIATEWGQFVIRQ